MRMTARLLAWLLVGGIVLQIFFIGSALLVDGGYLLWHKELGSGLAYLPFVIVVAALVGRLPRVLVLRAALICVLYLLQFVFLYVIDDIGLQAWRGLHAVNALVLFLTSIDLARRSGAEIKLDRK